MTRLFAVAATLAVLFATPVLAQQNMADVIYGSAQPGNGMMASNIIIGEGNRSHVSAAQAELKARGYKVKIDGDYGPKTRAAVKKFQKSQGLSADGVLGPQTMSALGLSVN